MPCEARLLFVLCLPLGIVSSREIPLAECPFFWKFSASPVIRAGALAHDLTDPRTSD
jgi:hypothetical protein